MKKLREAQERHREEVKARAEEARKKRLEDKAKERERKKEEKRIAIELIQSWSRRRDDLECEDLKGRTLRKCLILVVPVTYVYQPCLLCIVSARA